MSLHKIQQAGRLFSPAGLVLPSPVQTEECVRARQRASPWTHEVSEESSESAKETRCLAAGPGCERTAAPGRCSWTRKCVRSILLLTFARERFQFGLCPTFWRRPCGSGPRPGKCCSHRVLLYRSQLVVSRDALRVAKRQPECLFFTAAFSWHRSAGKAGTGRRRCPDVEARAPRNRPSIPVRCLAPPPPAPRRLRKALHPRDERTREKSTPLLLLHIHLWSQRHLMVDWQYRREFIL